MAVQPGRDLLLKFDQTGTGSFVTVAGLRSRRIAFAEEAVDVSTADSPDRWCELLAGAGLRRVSVSGTGVFRDAASDAAVRSAFFAGAVRAWRIVLPDFGTIEGPFLIATLEYAGTHDAEVTFEIALESAGAPTFAAL